MYKFCPNCIEDEMHFLMDCKCFAIHRKEFFTKINETIRDNNLQFQNRKEKFVTLLSNRDIIPHTAQYLVQTMYVRDLLLENYINLA